MDIGTSVEGAEALPAPAPKPKKPKAAKKAKPAPKKKAVKKPKPKAKKAKAKKPAKKAAKPKKAKVAKKTAPTVERFERLDMRLSKAEKAKITAKAKKLRRTITSVVIEAIEKLR